MTKESANELRKRLLTARVHELWRCHGDEPMERGLVEPRSWSAWKQGYRVPKEGHLKAIELIYQLEEMRGKVVGNEMS
jgi:hypothetical protein